VRDSSRCSGHRTRRGVGGSGHLERGVDLVQHALLAGAHLLAARAQEAALLGGVGGRLGRGQQPAAERLGLLGVALADTSSLTPRSSSSTCWPPRGLKSPSGFCLCWVMAWRSRATEASSSSWLGAGWPTGGWPWSLASSIGPPGSASEMATPATRGRVGSGSIPGRCSPVWTSWPPPWAREAKPKRQQGSSFAEDDERQHLHQACPTGIEAFVQPALSTSGHSETVGVQRCISGPSARLSWRSCSGCSSPSYGPSSTDLASDGVPTL
jgi:hypothetical protein